MPTDRKKRLDDVGFSWDGHNAKWEESLAALLASEWTVDNKLWFCHKLAAAAC
jgi:hypothetical protein